MPQPARIAVFVSGGGTNLQALIDRFHPAPAPSARVELVVGSREGIGALQRAAAARIPSRVLNPGVCGADHFPARLLEALETHAIDLVVLAGYLQLVPAVVVERYHGRMLNIHPALLPAFGGPGMYGIRVHRAVLESGARVSGATVHQVGERYDEGPIVAQWPVPVLPGDTPESLAARVLRAEHLVLPAAVEALVREQPGEPLRGPLAFDLLAREEPPEGSVWRLNRRASGSPPLQEQDDAPSSA